MKTAGGTIVAVLALLYAAAGAAHADEPGPTTRSGYERIRSFGGPDSVQSALRRHDEKKEAFYRGHAIENALAPWYRLKRCMEQRHGLAVGLDYNVLYQRATASLDQDEAAGGVFRLYGRWTALGRGTPTTSEIVFRVECRHRLGTDLAPSGLGSALGSLYKTANSFDGWGLGLTNLQWQQYFADGRYGVAVGQVDLRDWVDTFDLANWRTALLSAAVTYPTNPLPAAGLGGAAYACFRTCDTPYVLAGFSDANGKPSDPDLGSLFEQGEVYAFAELGWTPAFERRDRQNLRLTAWHQDARTEAGTPEGWGLSFSGSWRFADRYGPFLRAGWADGGVAPSEAAVVAGLGIHHRSHDLFGFALGWGRPHDADLRDQVTLETFYRLQLSQNVGITPDVELLFDPSKNPSESLILVLSLRLQLAF